MVADELGLVDLLVEGVAGAGVVGHGIAQLGQLVGYGSARGEQRRVDAHHDGEGFDDGAVEGEEYGEGQQAPEAAGHGVDLLLAVEAGHLLVEFLLVALVLALELLHARREPGHAHHALLALGHEGQQHERHAQREQYGGDTEVPRELVEAHHEPAKGFSYCI